MELVDTSEVESELTEEQTTAANTFIQTLQAGPINIAGLEDDYRPIIKHLRNVGHVVCVGNYFEQSDGKKQRWVTNGPAESAMSGLEF
jgi:hypothetical protein